MTIQELARTWGPDSLIFQMREMIARNFLLRVRQMDRSFLRALVTFHTGKSG
jgi:hypothetical protein